MNFPDREHVAFPARFASPYSLGVLLFFLLMVCISNAHAQSASLGGVVTDPSSAVVRNAQVTVTNQRTSVALHTKTNSYGLYSVPFIQPGLYTLTVEASGFKTYERKSITIETAQTVAIDVRLQVGETSQSVTVDGSGAQINTTDASVSTVIDRQFVQDIPLNGRSFQSLMTMVPGVSAVPSQGSGVSGELTVNGQRTEENYFTVDGVSVNTGAQPTGGGFGAGAGFSGSTPGETALGTTQSLVSIDALQEFRATTSTYAAEYGRTPGGQFSFTTRSGTNDLHGSLFDYFRNDALDANNYFNKQTFPVTPRQAERQNDFGGTFGGPIRIPGIYNGTDRTFFFFSYEGLRLRIPYAATLSQVPSLTLRSTAPTQIQPFLNAFPVPNGEDVGDGFANFTGGYSAPSSIDTSSIRIDHHFGDKFQLFGRYSHSPSNSQSRTAGPYEDMAVLNSHKQNMDTLTLGSTNSFTSSLASDLRFNYTWNLGVLDQATDSFGGATPLSSSFLNSIPGYNQGHWIEFMLLYGSFEPILGLQPQRQHQHQLNVVETMNSVVRRHNLKWGIDYRRTLTIGANPVVWQQGYYDTEAQVLANQTDVNAFLGPSQFEPVYSNFSAFVQDEWKATAKLALSLGLRWELNPAPKDAAGSNPYGITSTDPATLAMAPKDTPLWKTSYGNFAPRLGVAYQVHQQSGHETVLRAGVGLFYDTAQAPLGSQGYQGQGITGSASFSPTSFPLTSAQIASIPKPSANPPYTSVVWGFDPNLKLPYTLQWNLSLEQALGKDQTLTLGYVGAAGRRLLTSWYYLPQNNPNFAINGYGLDITTNGASSDYDALQVQFQRKMSHGLQVLASYTWAHALDDATTNFQLYRLIHADSDNDIRHNFQAGVTYQVPSAYQNKFVSTALGNWSIDARITSRSALPIDVLGAYVNLPAIGKAEYFQPHRVQGEPLYIYGSDYPGGRAINFLAYSMPTDANGNYIEGDAGRNSARGFGATQSDIALNRTFPIGDLAKLQFRVEAFNVFNQAIMGAIYNQLSYGQGTFGYAYNTENYQLGGLNSLYQVGGPRSLQIALKLHF